MTDNVSPFDLNQSSKNSTYVVTYNKKKCTCDELQKIRSFSIRIFIGGIVEMQFNIPFKVREKENNLIVKYDKMTNAIESGFNALKLPFDTNCCIGYPMIHAFFENTSLNGYERYCGWIQIIKREEYNTINGEETLNIIFDLDVSEEMRSHGLPYFAFGYPAELFDAPCNNLNGNEKVIWTAYTYLVDLPSRMNNEELLFLAGFSWGYIETIDKEIDLLNFQILSEKEWKEHRRYVEFQ